MLRRRRVLALLLSSALAPLLPRSAPAGPLDQGIGGTGAMPGGDESDRGIGGTGVIGTIRKFGSIVVNELRIAYPPDAQVRIDGQPASVADLKIGQVVRVAANGADGRLSTRAIDVTSEVVGPVEKARGRQLTVLGQSVSTAGLKTKAPRVGETVAVSGLRRNDGTIVASLIERRESGASRVAGPVTVAPDGALRIGGLTLSGAAPDLVGRRALVEGRKEDGGFVVSRGVSESVLLPSDVRSLSIESYVERRGDTLALGSGFKVAGATRIALAAGRSVRAVVNASIGADGGLVVRSLRADGRTLGGGSGGSRGGGGSGGGSRDGGEPRGGAGGADKRGDRVPMDFGRPGGEPGTPGSGGGAPGGGFGRGGFGGGGFGGGGMGGGGMGGGGMGGGGMGGGGMGGGGGRR